MSEQPNLLQIAKVLKSNGTEGELILSFKTYVPEDINTKEPVFICFDGLMVPFFITSYNIKGNRAYTKLLGVNNLTYAEELVGKAVYINYALGYEEDEFISVVGWKLHNSNGVIVGVITHYEDIPGNPCLSVCLLNNTTILIPFHEDLITDIDEQNKVLTMSVPEGLIE